MMNFIILLGVLNLVFLNIRVIIGVYTVFKGDSHTFLKWFNALEALATTVMLFVLLQNYFNF